MKKKAAQPKNAIQIHRRGMRYVARIAPKKSRRPESTCEEQRMIRELTAIGSPS